MRRAFTVVAGLALAILAAVATLGLVLAIMVMAMPGVSAQAPSRLVAALIGLAWSDHPEALARAALHAAFETVAVVCCAPVVCAALLGEAAGLRTLSWCGTATAALSVALPVAASSAGAHAIEASPAAIVACLAVGGVAGLAYWAVAGHSASSVQR